MEKHLETGYKFVYRTTLVRKYWKFTAKFIIELADKIKGVKSKIELHKSDAMNDTIFKVITDMVRIVKNNKILFILKV